MYCPPCRIKWWAGPKGSPQRGPLASRGPNSCRELDRIVQESTLVQSPKRRRMRRELLPPRTQKQTTGATQPPYGRGPLKTLKVRAAWRAPSVSGAQQSTQLARHDSQEPGRAGRCDRRGGAKTAAYLCHSLAEVLQAPDGVSCLANTQWLGSAAAKQQAAFRLPRVRPRQSAPTQRRRKRGAGGKIEKELFSSPRPPEIRPQGPQPPKMRAASTHATRPGTQHKTPPATSQLPGARTCRRRQGPRRTRSRRMKKGLFSTHSSMI